MKLYSEFVAFDIGTQSLKCLSLLPGSSGVGYHLSDLLTEDLPLGLVGGGFTNPFIRDPALFARHLKGMVRKVSSKKSGCIVGLPDRWVKLHIQSIALKPRELENPEYISWRLAKVLPIPESLPVVIDHQILSIEEGEDGYIATIMAGAVARDMIDLLSRMLASQSLEVMGFESSTMGVYNLLEEAQPENAIDRNLIMCHVGHETTVVKIYHRGILAYERVIEVAGEEMGKIYGGMENLDAEEGQKQKAGLSLYHEDRGRLLKLISGRGALERVFGNWLRELNVTFRFYQEKFKILHLPKLYLTGGACLFEGLPEFLSEYLGTACFRFNPFSDLPSDCEIPAAQARVGPQFAPCLGLLTV